MVPQTIFALSSGQPPAGLAVIRISGPETKRTIDLLTGSVPEPRRSSLKTIRRRNGEALDEGLVLFFPGPHSFTGEDCAEFQVHGSRAVVNALSEALLELGLRQAEAGEFARRAFEHGRLDLVEVEGLSDLVSAETEMQRKLALQTGMGTLSRQYFAWAERLTYARAMIEAELDFADEEDAPTSAIALIDRDLEKLLGEMRAATQSARSAEIIRNGYNIAIVGAPNAGKSSLLNALARREVAIVTEVAGTTRDVITVDLDLDGYLVRLFDTAGIREASDIVEREGIRRTRAVAQDADLILYLEEIAAPPLEEESFGTPVLRVGTKLDLYPQATGYDLCISCESGAGLDQLHEMIASHLREIWQVGTAVGKQRHLEHIRAASNFVENAIQEPRPELMADALRAAGDELGRITGRVDVEDLLDVIFSKFCIGK
jgi:tRNA modification GTPase